jgi:purine-binding chemotaxis protein CheW
MTGIHNSFLVFQLGEQRCALPLAQVERVVRAVGITPLPQAREESPLRGVINVHGAVVPVFDLRPTRALGPEQQMILVTTGDGRRGALLCDDVEGVREAPPQDIAPARDLLPAALAQPGGSGGILKDGSGLIHLHDLETLLLHNRKTLDEVMEAGNR